MEKVLEFASQELDEVGAVKFNILNVINKSGVSRSSVYHHFGDRDGLIRAAYVETFRRAIQSDIDRVKRFMSRMTSAKEIAEHYDEMLAFLNHHFEQFPARDRAATIGSTTGRPLLKEAIIAVQTELTSGLTEVMQLLKDRGILKPHLAPRAAAVMTLGMLHGRVVAEFDSTPVHDEQWNAAMLASFNGLFASS